MMLFASVFSVLIGLTYAIHCNFLTLHQYEVALTAESYEIPECDIKDCCLDEYCKILLVDLNDKVRCIVGKPDMTSSTQTNVTVYIRAGDSVNCPANVSLQETQELISSMKEPCDQCVVPAMGAALTVTHEPLSVTTTHTDTNGNGMTLLGYQYGCYMTLNCTNSLILDTDPVIEYSDHQVRSFFCEHTSGNWSSQRSPTQYAKLVHCT